MNTPPVQQMLTREEGLAVRLRGARGDEPSKDFAARLGWQPPKVSKIEAGKQLPSPEELDAWAHATGVDEASRTLWHALLVEAKGAHRDWNARLRARGQKGVQEDYHLLVEDAAELNFFEVDFIPRFFQVPAYTRAVLTWVNEEYEKADDVEEGTAVRQADVNFLYSDKRFRLLIAEPALYWRHPALPPVAMRQQLDRLLAVDGLPNVEFGILPLLGEHRSWPRHSFEIYGDVLSLERIHDAEFIRDEAVISRYRRVFSLLWASALTGEQARELVHRAIAVLPRA